MIEKAVEVDAKEIKYNYVSHKMIKMLGFTTDLEWIILESPLITKKI